MRREVLQFSYCVGGLCFYLFIYLFIYLFNFIYTRVKHQG